MSGDNLGKGEDFHVIFFMTQSPLLISMMLSSHHEWFLSCFFSSGDGLVLILSWFLFHMSAQSEIYNLGLTMHNSKQMDQIDPTLTAETKKGIFLTCDFMTYTHCFCSFLTMLYEEIKKKTTVKKKKIMGTWRMSIQVFRNYLLRVFKHLLNISSHQFISFSSPETINFWRQELYVLFMFIYIGISSTEHSV